MIPQIVWIGEEYVAVPMPRTQIGTPRGNPMQFVRIEGEPSHICSLECGVGGGNA